MTKVAIVGCNGKMGGFVAQAVQDNAACEALFGVDAFGNNKYEFPWISPGYFSGMLFKCIVILKNHLKFIKRLIIK